MDDEEFGTTDDYIQAFKAIQAEGIPENHLALLRAHLTAPGHMATWAHLAVAVGYPNFNTVNLQYGRLAARIAAQLGVQQPPRDFWLYVLVVWASERDSTSDHTAFVLRRPVIAALNQLGLLKDATFDLLPDEMSTTDPIREGTRYQVLVNAHERNREARRQCIAIHGTTCCICEFDFGSIYGPEAQGYIHVHHVKPLSEISGEYIVDPARDLRPVCPNCHAFLHLGGRCREIAEVRELIRQLRAARISKIHSQG